MRERERDREREREKEGGRGGGGREGERERREQRRFYFTTNDETDLHGYTFLHLSLMSTNAEKSGLCTMSSAFCRATRLSLSSSVRSAARPGGSVRSVRMLSMMDAAR